MVLSQPPLSLRQDVTFFKRAHRLNTQSFVVYWEKQGFIEDSIPVSVSQVSIIVPKHQLKTSVKRHRVKRQFRGAWQRVSSALLFPVRVVFIANRSALNLKPNELETLLHQQIDKMNAAESAQ